MALVIEGVAERRVEQVHNKESIVQQLVAF